MDRRRLLLGLAGVVGATGAATPGRRNLQGVWTTSSYTDLERPPELPRLLVTPQEAEAFEAPRRALNGRLPSRPEELGQAEGAWSDRGAGLARVNGQIRRPGSWIPPTGASPSRRRRGRGSASTVRDASRVSKVPN